MRTRGARWTAPVQVLLLVLVAVPGLRAQAPSDEGPPVTMDELLSMIGSGMSEAAVGGEVDRRCLAFRLDDAFAIRQVTGAGASLDLVGQLQGACVEIPRPPLINPAVAFAHSLVIPGTGQMRTGRGWRGALVLAGSAAAVSYGFLSATVTKRCREPLVGGECLSGELTTADTERPNLTVALAGAGALVLIGAVDALMGARQVNRERLEAAGFDTTDGVSFNLLPNSLARSARAGDLRLLEVRFR